MRGSGLHRRCDGRIVVAIFLPVVLAVASSFSSSSFVVVSSPCSSVLSRERQVGRE